MNLSLEKKELEVLVTTPRLQVCNNNYGVDIFDIW
jgi:hypothetical protein